MVWPCCIDLPAGNIGIVPVFIFRVVPDVLQAVNLGVLEVTMFEHFLCIESLLFGIVGRIGGDHGGGQVNEHQGFKHFITAKVS